MRFLPLFAAALVAAANPFIARARGAAHSQPAELLDTLTFGRWTAYYRVGIPNCATFGHRLIQVLLRNAEGRVYIESLHLTFADRKVEWIPVRRTYGPGEESTWFDLNVHGYRDNRCLAYLQVGGVSLDPRVPARVEVYGISENTTGPTHSGH